METTELPTELPVNCAARYALWTYPRLAPPRFSGAPSIVEPTRSYLKPDLDALPEEADLEVDFYGGSVKLSPAGVAKRVYIRRHVYTVYRDYREALLRFDALWEAVCRLDSGDAINEAAERWLELEIEERRAKGSYLGWLDARAG